MEVRQGSNGPLWLLSCRKQCAAKRHEDASGVRCRARPRNARHDAPATDRPAGRFRMVWPFRLTDGPESRGLPAGRFTQARRSLSVLAGSRPRPGCSQGPER
jgi:hypothetical protein